jgi:hypothetical protein
MTSKCKHPAIEVHRTKLDSHEQYRLPCKLCEPWAVEGDHHSDCTCEDCIERGRCSQCQSLCCYCE